MHDLPQDLRKIIYGHPRKPMANSFKMQGATAKSGPPLCLKCKYSAVVRGQNCEEAVFCSSYSVWAGNGPMRVPFKVSECTEYKDKNTPDIEDMRRIAWEVVARKRGTTGFAKGQNENPDELVTEINPPKKRGEPEDPLDNL